MIVDSSAIIAILLKEDDAPFCMEKLSQATSISMSAVSFGETAMVLLTRGEDAALRALDPYLNQIEAEIVPVDRAQSVVAAQAYDRYGKGRHPAHLNLGDCFVYALAKLTGEPLLFIGNDFGKTDLLLA